MGIGVKKDRRILKEIVNRNFTFADLNRKFEGVDSSTGNIFCPFHHNVHSPHAKMYWDDDKDIYVIVCFKDHKKFTPYDYVDLILCKQKEYYKDVLSFLEAKMTKSDILTQYNALSKNIESLDDSIIQKKITYIDNVYNECESTEEYIERLYTN